MAFDPDIIGDQFLSIPHLVGAFKWEKLSDHEATCSATRHQGETRKEVKTKVIPTVAGSIDMGERMARRSLLNSIACREQKKRFRV